MLMWRWELVGEVFCKVIPFSFPWRAYNLNIPMPHARLFLQAYRCNKEPVLSNVPGDIRTQISLQVQGRVQS